MNLLKRKLAFIGMKGLPPDRPGAGGGEREADAKTRRLAKRGYNITAYCRRNYLPEAPTEYEGMRLITLPSIGGPGLEMLSHTLLSTLDVIFCNRVEVVNYHGMGNALFVPLLKLAGIRSVVYMDGIDWERPKWGFWARQLLRMSAFCAFRLADRVYVDNYASQQRFKEFFGREPQLITLGADLWEAPGTEALETLDLESEKYLLFVGMLRPDKGVHLLIEAYNQLETDIPLVIVGENPDAPDYVQKLKEMAGEGVRFVGYQYGDAAQQLFANCMIYVQPSVMEGNSPALMSAMACKRCVVVNGIEQNRETIGDSGVAFDAGNPADLAMKLKELLGNPEQIEAFGQRARQRIETVYNWEKVVDQIERLYSEVFQTKKEVGGVDTHRVNNRPASL